ncbi:MAG: M24 family metallopeptidase [Terriglobia bacterium]
MKIRFGKSFRVKDPERIDRIRKTLRENRWDMVVCALPMNVLLLSGYWPVVGTGLAIASAEGRISLLVPEDEEDLAKHGWADDVQTFNPGALGALITTAEAIRDPLRKLAKSFPAGPVRVGFEAYETSEPASYAAMHLYTGSIQPLLDDVLSRATLAPADEALADLRSRKTDCEIKRIRTACRIAARAFEQGFKQMRAGATELETAAGFREPLSASLVEFPELERADGFAWCMSGANSALASGAYARSRAKRIEWGDLVLVHCNSYADGYWTDITRTYSLGKLEDRREQMYDAVFAAREAALGAIRPGAHAAEVDAAARNVLKKRGFGPQFKHSTGHGVGFSAINADAGPRLHPKSQETMETGMVFNVEPGIYFDGYGGIRHCDMVALTNAGAELLTSFQCRADELRMDS